MTKTIPKRAVLRVVRNRWETGTAMLLGLALGLGALAHQAIVTADPAFESDRIMDRSSRRIDLSKGVVALNMNRSVYVPNQTATLQIGVVDGHGRTICDAEVELTVIPPNGDSETLSTGNGGIRRNPECGPDSVIDSPDYFAYYTPRSLGSHDLTLSARTSDVVRKTRDRFEVREDQPFDIERFGPTRIYPVADYPMTFRVKANAAYRGAVREYLPKGFEVRGQHLRLKNHGSARFHPIHRPFASREANTDRKVLAWSDITLEAGDELEVTYEFNAPNTSPELYLLGRAELDGYVETRQWQIAVDATAVFDTFTETSDTPITSHSPDTGIGWTEVYDSTGAGTDAEVSETTDIFHASVMENGVGQAYTAQPAPSTTDQNVSITLKVLDTTSSDRVVGIFARRTDNDNFYHVQLLPNTHASPSITLYKFEGGFATSLGTFDATLAIGTVIKLEVRDATKKVFVDGMERISSSDNSLTAAGTWGVYFGDFNGAGIGGDVRGTWKVDDFLAEDGALGPVKVFYSVGTDNTALYSDTAFASGGTLTLNSPAADKIGVGDEIRRGANRHYITGRNSATEFRIQNSAANGGSPGDTNLTFASTAITIFRAFNSLSAAETGSSDANHLATADLVTGSYQLNWPCYKDGPMDDQVTISGYSTDADTFIKVYTPVYSSEVGASQRHTGKARTGFRLQPTSSSDSDTIIVNDAFVRIEGLEMDGSLSTAPNGAGGVDIETGAAAPVDHRVSHNIIYETGNFTGIYVNATSAKVWNNVCHRCDNPSVSNTYGALVMDHAGGTAYFYNNTIYDSASNGIARNAGTLIATNNLAMNSNRLSSTFTDFAGAMTQSYNVSSDATAAGAGSQINMAVYASYFADTTLGAEDLHLLDNSFNLWGSYGTDLSGDSNLPVTDDIDGQGRAHPDIGADERAPTRIYYSVGTDNTVLYSDTAFAFGGTLTLNSQAADKIGVGDEVRRGANRYYITGRNSATEFTIQNSAANGGSPGDTNITFASTAITIFRAFNSLSAAEAGSSDANHLGTSDLVIGNYQLNWPCYGDGEDSTSVVISGWTTGSDNYIEIYTPVLLAEVGTSQRHDGKWDTTSAYRIANTSATDSVIEVNEQYVRIDGLQVDAKNVSGTLRGIFVDDDGSDAPAEIYISNCIVRMSYTATAVTNVRAITALDNFAGADSLFIAKVWNNIVYGWVGTTSTRLLELSNDGTLYAYNNTLIGDGETGTESIGIDGAGGNLVYAKNNISIDSKILYDAVQGSPSTNNFSDKLDAPGTNPQNGNGSEPVFVDKLGNDFHLASGDTLAQNFGADLSADGDLAFTYDIDQAGRTAPWDIGADDVLGTTAVELVSFDARAGDGATELFWETGSELDNLGFHLYRSLAEQGPFERTTTKVIPGLGSSPEGANYAHRDSGLTNGMTYYYKLEAIETTGHREFHGPVSATPHPSASSSDEDSGAGLDEEHASLVTYGDPSANTLRVLTRTRRELVLELSTEGFYAEPLDDGTVALRVPGFESLIDASGPALPVKRTWLEVVSGRQVELVSVRPSKVRAFTSLRPSNAELPEVVATLEGTVRASRRRAPRAFRGDGLSPPSAARIVSVGFQEDVKKALVELAPLQWDGAGGQLLLARRLEVRLSFRGREPSEPVAGRGYARRRSHDRRQVVAHLVTTQAGLYGIRYEDVMPARRTLPTRSLRLSRQGETVAYHLEPALAEASVRQGPIFGPGSVLYFLSEGANANPYGLEAVYELELGTPGETMTSVSAAPNGPPQPVYWQRREWEENHYYQATLVEAPDVWLWDLLFAPQTKSYPLEVSGMVSGSEPSKLSVWLQGVSDFPAAPDHHLRLYVNGSLVGEVSWDGKQAKRVDIDLAPGVLGEGENVLEIENVGDTEASYSMVMLDRYALEYPRGAVANQGQLRGRWSLSGTAELSGLAPGAQVVETSDVVPRWLVATQQGADGLLRFGAEAGRSYLAVSPDVVLHPAVRTPRASRLKNKQNRADYLLIAPELFLHAAEPLLELRRAQGLSAEAVSIEQISSEFGFGETTPEAVKDFLSYAYHQWRQPSPRYVLLVGDATYDFKDDLQTGVTNQVPPLMVKTSYMWTASDPSYAALNGEDILPDLAIGRLPAATLGEARAMVQKILAYETGEVGLDSAPVVLVADNSDRAGDFEADANALSAGVLAFKNPQHLYLSELGAATRQEIVRSFDEGLSLVSYIGHGGIHLWAEENVFNVSDVGSLETQSQQPLLLTMNCLNGYFHFPYFDSLAEALVKVPDKGAIAAFAPTGLSLNRPASRFHQALLEELFDQNHRRLGDAILAAQESYAESGAFPELLSIYHLLGDPALKLR